MILKNTFYRKNTMEKIIKVDIDDNKIGEVEKLEAHLTPILHRAFSVFLYDGNKILLQQRAFNKYHSGGLWANSCCSHPRANLSFLESVNNRIKFELGINEILNLTEIFSFTYFSKYSDNLYEYEYDHVLVGKYPSNLQINFNTEEIANIKWIEINKLKKELIENPAQFATWFLICAPKVIQYLENM